MGDVLSILEAAYSETAGAEAWLAGALAAVGPHLDRGSGVWAHRYQHRAGAVWTSAIHAYGVTGPGAQSLGEALAAMHVDVDEVDWGRVYPSRPTASWSSELLGPLLMERMLEVLRERTGMTNPPDIDSLGVIAGDPSGHGCIFFTNAAVRPPRRDPKGRLTARQAEHWRRIAGHLVAGHRLARQRDPQVDAVLSPDGKVLHVERNAANHRAALAAATRGIDQARGPLRRTDPERALRIWRDVVAGRWSLVDQYDHDGRRFVVARRNARPPETPLWSALTEREARVVSELAMGQSHKAIASAVGVSVAVVAADLAAARTKMGARTRLELAAAYRAAHDAAE